MTIPSEKGPKKISGLPKSSPDANLCPSRRAHPPPSQPPLTQSCHPLLQSQNEAVPRASRLGQGTGFLHSDSRKNHGRSHSTNIHGVSLTLGWMKIPSSYCVHANGWGEGQQPCAFLGAPGRAGLRQQGQDGG